MKITNWRTETVFIDQDTGEILNATNERQLKNFIHVSYNLGKNRNQIIIKSRKEV